MPRIDYQELKALSEEVTKLRQETVGYLKDYDKSNDAFTEDRELSGMSWSSGKRYHAQYKLVSDAIFNALYDLDDSLKNYLAEFKNIVGEAENRLDTDELQELENDLRRLQTQKLEFMEAMAVLFKDVPVLKEFFGNNSMVGRTKEIEILKRYEYFERSTQGSFDGVQETIQAILEGLSYLGQSKNFENGASGYQVADLSASAWYTHLTKYNQANQEDQYEIREIKTNYGTVYQVLKNGKVQKKASEELQKSKVMETVGMMAELTPELIKTLVGIDDVEVLMDDGSTKLQKSEAGIWLLLSALPPDKIKDILKSAKLAQHSNKAFDSIRLTEKEWEKLKALDKANDAIKIEKKIPIKKLDSLPDNVTKSHEVYKKNGWSGNVASQTPGTKAGSSFKNRDARLPTMDKNGKLITYQEFDVNSKLPNIGRDSERFVKGSDGNLYYTNDHYESFVKVE